VDLLAKLGISLEAFVMENISLPDELQKMLDQRISMNMLGDMNKYTQFQVAQSMPIAAANEGGGAAGIGAGLGAGMVMAQNMMNAMRPPEPPGGGGAAPALGVGGPAPAGGAPASGSGGPAAPAAPATGTKFCMNCGKSIPKGAKFCPECGGAQS
jgi:membrane protease subunit (stomatin/prohibitin family)